MNYLTTEITEIHNMKNHAEAIKRIQSLADENLILHDDSNGEETKKIYNVEIGKHFDTRG